MHRCRKSAKYANAKSVREMVMEKSRNSYGKVMEKYFVMSVGTLIYLVCYPFQNYAGTSDKTL